MTDNPNYSYIHTIRTPDGATHYIKDAEAREEITKIASAAVGGLHFLGITTTALTDKSTTQTIVVNGESVTAKLGDFCLYQSGGTYLEFFWVGSFWTEAGSAGALKSLAFKDSATGSVTPTGTVSTPSVTITAATDTVPVNSMSVSDCTLTFSSSNKTVVTGATAALDSAPTFTGDSVSITVS